MPSSLPGIVGPGGSALRSNLALWDSIFAPSLEKNCQSRYRSWCWFYECYGFIGCPQMDIGMSCTSSGRQVVWPAFLTLAESQTEVECTKQKGLSNETFAMTRCWHFVPYASVVALCRLGEGSSHDGVIWA